jgi:DNA-binding PadR family transcriptional regulator
VSEPAEQRLIRDLFLAFIKVHILHHAAEGPVYGLALIEELGSHGYVLSPGTLYPTLHALGAAGYLSREDRAVEGRVRKYYTITSLGRLALANARARIKMLVDEVLAPVGPDTIGG